MQYFSDVLRTAIKQGYKPVLNGPNSKSIAIKECIKCGAKSAHFISPQGNKWDVCSEGCRTRLDSIIQHSQRSASLDEAHK